jgi:hypothetical protein
MTDTTASHAPAIRVAVLPAGIDVHLETQHRLVWTEFQSSTFITEVPDTS